MKKGLRLVFVFLLLHGVSRGDLVAHYAFDGATYADSAGYAGVVPSLLTRGVAAATDSNFSNVTSPFDGGTHSFFLRGSALNTPNGGTEAAFGSALTQGNYISFTVTSLTPMYLTSLMFDTAKSPGTIHNLRALATSDVTGHVYTNRLDIVSPTEADSSLPDVLQSLGAVSLSDSPAGLGVDWGLADNTVIDLSVPAFQGVTSVNFRVYGFTMSNPTFNVANILRFDNVMLNGSFIPEPGSLPLCLIGCGVIVMMRSRKRTFRA
jgi:hypothetical protein